MRSLRKELIITGEGKEDIIKGVNKCMKFLKKEAKKGTYDRFFIYVSYTDDSDKEIRKYESFCEGNTEFEKFMDDVISGIETEKKIKYSYVSASAEIE